VNESFWHGSVKIPSAKHQITKKIPSTKFKFINTFGFFPYQTEDFQIILFCILVFGHYDLFEIWCL